MTDPTPLKQTVLGFGVLVQPDAEEKLKALLMGIIRTFPGVAYLVGFEIHDAAIQDQVRKEIAKMQVRAAFDVHTPLFPS